MCNEYDIFDDADDEEPRVWFFEIDDDTGDAVDAWPADEDPGLGGCRMCGKQGPKARNVLMMDFTAPVPGTGWACLVCGLEANGAIAVLCDDCMDGWQREYIDITHVCKGLPGDGERIGIDEYEHEPFEHDVSKHENGEV